MDRGTWQATVHGITKSQAQLSDEDFHLYFAWSAQSNMSWTMAQKCHTLFELIV